MSKRPFAVIVLLVTACIYFQGAAQERAIEPHHAIAAARAHWERGAHATGQGNPTDLRQRAIAQKVRMRQHRFANAIGTGTAWTLLGPMPLPSDASGIGLQDYNWITGRATAIAVDPNDSSGNTMFIGGANGGIWKSINAGALSPTPSSILWSPLTDDQPTLAIGAIAVQPQTSNPNPANSIVIAGTGETNSSADSYYGLGILRSTNGGQTWTLTSQDATGAHPFAGLGFSKIAFSAFNPNVVVAGAGSASEGVIEDLENPVAVNRGIYYSNDAGATWNAASITDLGTAITPASVTSVAYNAASAKFYAAVRNHGFYASFDGINWLRLATQPGLGLSAAACPTQAPQQSACPFYRGEISVVPNRTGPKNAGEMYVWYTDSNDVDSGIWQSLDGGFSWTQIDDSGITNCGDLAGGCGTEFASDNLALAAVPNGTATDLYAGAQNLYKCSISILSPTCSSASGNGFINLTHVYGCSNIAKVYPGQHAIDFPVTAGALGPIYFASDGGIYRALNGSSDLASGTCGVPNQFDSLNQTLGPMIRFTSLTESASNPNLLFGGTSENGAPATNVLESGGAWANVNAGNVGATAINPSNDNEWFLSTPPDGVSGVNLFSCSSGTNCHTQDFAINQVADSLALGGDTGGFRLPFIFDPANPATLIVGTCKVWRGSAAGGNFSLLSPDFENGGTGVCSGSETNMVRAIAAGGPVDSNGNSQVIYAATNGDGPRVAVTPVGGHLWVTTNANVGTASWLDRTGNINPLGFPISSVVVDPTDRTGQTAYVGIMGFGTSQIWKTTNAGLSWTDFTANLPNGGVGGGSSFHPPVNSIAIDASAATIYVGTDIGVFASSTSSPSWAEVGPASGAGFLPEVPVTALQIFNSGGLKQLRAATFGRGIWQWNLVAVPDFQINVANTSQTIFAGQSAIYNGTLVALNGYGSNVNLSCTAGSTSPPQTCSVTPSSVLPTPQGTVFTVNAMGTAGDYGFNVHAVGTDPASVTHVLPVTLHIADFSLSAPAPAKVTVAAGTVSGTIVFALASVGSFNGQVALACSGLPSGATCNFQPSNVISPPSDSSIAVTLIISAAVNAALGSFLVTLSASSPGLSAKTQSLTLSVTAPADYKISIPSSSLTSGTSSPATFSGTLTAVNGYSSAVTLSCGSGAPPTCTPSPASLAPTPTGTPFTVTVSSGVAQAYSFNINVVGSDPVATAHSVPVTFTTLATPDYIVAIAKSSLTSQVNTPTTFSGTLTAINGYSSAVTLSCSSGAPPSCVPSPASVVPSAAGTPFTVAVSSGISQAYAFNIDALGSDQAATSHSIPVNFTSLPQQSFDFKLSVTPPSVSVSVGQSAIYTLDVSPVPNTSSFPGTVTFSCSNLPALTTCSFNPPEIAAGSGDSIITVTVATTAAVPVATLAPALGLTFAFVTLFLVPLRTTRSKRKLACILVLTLGAALSSSSCGGGLQGNSVGGSGTPGTPPGCYNLNINVEASVTHAAQVGLTVGSGCSTSTNPTPGQAEGVYSGTASNGDSFESIVLPNDVFYAIYGITNGKVLNVSGIMTGQGNSANGSYTASVSDFQSTGAVNTGSVSASYVPGVSIDGMVTETGNPAVTFTGTVMPSSSFNYNSPATLGNIAGTWSGTLLGGSSATVTINASGTFSGIDSGCSFSGSISPDVSGKNFFNVTMTFGASPCLDPNQTARGIAVSYLLSDGVTTQLLAGVSSGSSFGTVFVANN